jgi:tetratricopeptide (TPR) repeat protein
MVVRSLATRSVLEGKRGDTGASLRYARAAVELAERLQFPQYLMLAYYRLGMALNGAREHKEALDALNHAWELNPSAAPVLTELWIELSEARLATGDDELAREAAETAFVEGSGRGAYPEGIASLQLARVLLRTEGAGAAERASGLIDRADDLLRRAGVSCFDGNVQLERAELARVLGDDAARVERLDAARRIFIEMGAPLRAAAVGE